MSDPNFSVTYNGSGMFTITANGETHTLNIADMDIMLRTEQVEIYDQEIADQYAEIKEANMKRKALNELLVKMREQKTEKRDDDAEHGGSVAGEEFSLPGYEDHGNQDVDYWRDEFGLGDWDVDHSKGTTEQDAQWDVGIEAAKAAIDAISSDTELLMLRFRQMVDKRGTALQEAKSTMQQDKQLKDTIIRS